MRPKESHYGDFNNEEEGVLEQLIQSRVLEQLINSLFDGLSGGSVLLISALGLAVVFGLMGVINLAHGELMMLGAYATYVVQNGVRFLGDRIGGDGPLADQIFSTYIFLALPAAFIVAALAGLLLERLAIRHLYGRPLETLLATWGVSLILQQFVRSVNWVFVASLLLFSLLFIGGRWVLQRRGTWDRIRVLANVILFPLSVAIAIVTGFILAQSFKLAVTKPWFGTQGVSVSAPIWLQDGLALEDIKIPGLTALIESLQIGGVQFSYARLFIIALTIACIAGTYWFLNGTNWGLRIRAVTQNRDMSACLGIPTRKVDTLTFAIGSGLAGIAGCAVSLLGSVSPNTGQNYIVNTFMVVVVGGVGKLIGSIVAALGIGMTSSIIESGLIARLFGEDGVLHLEFLFKFFDFFAQSSMARVMVFALIIAFLQIRPAGLFPQKGRTVDA